MMARSYHAASRITGITQNLWATRTVTTVNGTATATLSELYTAPLNWMAGYDSRNRLTSLVRFGASTSYTYDPNSNRLTAVDGASSDTEHEQVRIAGELRPARQQRFVLVLRRPVDLDPDVVVVDQLLHVGIAGDEVVQDMAPAAPLAAHVDQHPLALRLGGGGRRGDVGRGVAGRIEFDQQALGERAMRDHGQEDGGEEFRERLHRGRLCDCW